MGMQGAADACEAGSEGNPLRLAERRTLSFPNRKIVIGSTPLNEDTSHVLRAYGVSELIDDPKFIKLGPDLRSGLLMTWCVAAEFLPILPT